MKPLIRNTSKQYNKGKQSTQDYEAKYWGCLIHKGVKRKRANGQEFTDKTFNFHSRRQKKQEIRNANRSITKRARQLLKKEMLDEIE